MFTEISIEEIGGKAVAGFAASDISPQAVITFTDGTFTALGMQHPWRGQPGIVPERLRLTEFGDTDILTLGLATQEELDAERKRIDEKFRAEREARDREAYEHLRKKFEG